MENAVPQRRADSFGALIPGMRGRIFATLYTPAGDPPYPTVVFCHGMPGNEKLPDFVVRLREEGFCTLQFHYSGSWGSDGDFSVKHCLEDTETVFRYVADNPEGLFDNDRVFVLGHSLGGLCGSFALGCLETVKAGVIIVPYNLAALAKAAEKDSAAAEWARMLHDELFAPWLKGLSWAQTYADYVAEPERYDLTSYAEKIAQKKLLLISGSLDDVLPQEEHVGALLAAVRAFGTENESFLSYETDHGLNSCREAAREAVTAFFRGQL